MPEPTRVLLVDDHVMFRDGVRRRLEDDPSFVVAGEVSSAEAAQEFLERIRPDIMVLDIRLPGVSGIAFARRCRATWPQVKILVVSGYDFDQYISALMRIGIEGYLTKDVPLDDFVTALREVAGGGMVFPPAITAKVVRTYHGRTQMSPARRASELTLRELEILEVLSEGLTNPKIAERLGLSPRTVDSHVAAIISKLGAKGRTDAVRLAMEQGLLP